jgi:hypothetical protein
MSQFPMVSNGPGCSCLSFANTDWAGGEHATQYLHLSAFPCERCNGPVIAGWLGTRHDHISQEADIQEIGAVCLACSFKPEIKVEPLAGHRFRPVEWEWVIKDQEQPADPGDDALAAELSQDADTVNSAR